MKITKVEIFGFGKFKDKTIEFNTDTHLIFGGNEAGKSSLYNFIKYMLFGIEKGTKSRREFKPKEANSLYGGRLFFDTHEQQRVKLTRLNNQKDGLKANTPLVELPSGLTGHEKLLHDLIKPLTKDLFTDVYSFQQEQLIELNKVSAKELQETLMSTASSGSQRLFKEKAKLLNQNKELFAKNGTKPSINQTMNKLLKIEQLIAEKEQQESHYHATSQQLLTLQQQVTEKKKLRDDLLELKQQCLAQIEQFENYDKYQKLKNAYQEKIKEVSLSQSDELERLKDYYQEWLTLQNEVNRLKEKQDSTKMTLIDEGSQAFLFYQKERNRLKELTTFYPKATEIKGQLIAAKGRLLAINAQLEALTVQWGFDPLLPPKEILEPQRDEMIQINQKFEALRIEEEQILADINQLYRENSSLQQQLLEYEEVEMTPIKETKQQNSLFSLIIGLIVASSVLIFMEGLFKWVTFLVIVSITITLFYILKQPKKELDDATTGFNSEKRHLTKLLSQNQARLQELENSKNQLPQKKQRLSLETAQFVDRLNLGKLDSLIDIIRFSDKPQEFNSLLAEQKNIINMVSELEAKLSTYQDATQLVKDWVPLANLDVTEQLEAITEFVSTMEKQEHIGATTTLSTVNDQLEANQRQQKELLKRISPALTKARLDDVTEIPNYVKEIKELQQLQEMINYHVAILTPIFNLDEQVDKDTIKNNLALLTQKLTILKEEIDAAYYQETQLKATVDNLIRNGTLAEAYQTKALLTNELTELANQWLSNKLEDQLFSELILEMSDQTLPQLLQKASHYFAVLTSQNYKKINLLDDDTLEIINSNGLAFRPIDLSTGTKDQLFMALRLAFITNKTKASSPIIIDDGWLHYDNERKYNLLDLLTKEIAGTCQIIVLTSDLTVYQYYQKNHLNITTLT